MKLSTEDCFKVCLHKMLVHAFFACRAHAQCLDCARNNVWNAIILEAVAGNGQFLNLQVVYPKSRTELCFIVTLCYMTESRVPARQVWKLYVLSLHFVQ